ncbi:MAG: hypothetical protein UT02_C0014G0009 [Parcubacteria group bacterium GW2011_GWC2_38_7]|nr:MAG: hypothetical protein UT02_C0014G0009 [Parcubacteria group bacterium GW2011_GWC2_38_7]
MRAKMGTFFKRIDRRDFYFRLLASNEYYVVLGDETKGDCLVIVHDQKGGRVCWWGDFKIALEYSIAQDMQPEWRNWLDDKAWLSMSEEEAWPKCSVSQLGALWASFMMQFDFAPSNGSNSDPLLTLVEIIAKHKASEASGHVCSCGGGCHKSTGTIRAVGATPSDDIPSLLDEELKGQYGL